MNTIVLVLVFLSAVVSPVQPIADGYYEWWQYCDMCGHCAVPQAVDQQVDTGTEITTVDVTPTPTPVPTPVPVTEEEPPYRHRINCQNDAAPEMEPGQHNRH